jgi:MAF protein
MKNHGNAEMIILASSSPYRRQLLERLKLPFICISPEIDESAVKGESPAEMAMRLANKKAEQVARHYPEAIIIGSDLVAVHDSNILSKPGNYEMARKQLKKLSGQKTCFMTGLCVLNSRTGSMQTDCISFNVEFRILDDMEIERYLDLEPAYDCAGSFKSEGLGISLLAHMEGGDHSSLIGLPLIRLCAMLRKEGINLP